MNNTEEIETFNVHNKKNKLVSRQFINDILKRFNITKRVNNLDIWRRAFVHKSYCIHRKKKFKNEDFEYPNDNYKYIQLQEESSECLEWLGDGIIQAVTAQYLWKRYPKQNEGFLTKTRSKLVRTDALARFARYLKLQSYVLISFYMESIGNGRENPKILEDVFESFMGAMSEDLGNSPYEGYKFCYDFFVRIMERVVDFADLIQRDDNYKDQLMRYCHQRFKGINPKYESINVNTDGKIKIYTEAVRDIVDGKTIIGKGTARSKKEAQQISAKNALIHYGVLET